MSSVDILKIKKLFQEKRFPEIIFEIESLTTDQNRSSALHNLLGVCRATQKSRSDRDIEYAFKDFETANIIMGQFSECLEKKVLAVLAGQATSEIEKPKQIGGISLITRGLFAWLKKLITRSQR